MGKPTRKQKLVEPTDTTAACTVASVFAYFSVLNSLADLNRQCFAASVSPVAWGVDNPAKSEQKGAGKFARLYGLTNTALPIYDIVKFSDKGFCDIPPAGVCLSDRLVFHIIVNIKCGRKRRGEMFPKDFDSDGNILDDRVPRGPTVVVWANGIPYCPVWGGYYALRGEAHHAQWLIRSKPAIKDVDNTFFIGLAIHDADTVGAVGDDGHRQLRSFDNAVNSPLFYVDDIYDLAIWFQLDSFILVAATNFEGWHARVHLDAPRDDTKDKKWVTRHIKDREYKTLTGHYVNNPVPVLIKDAPRYTPKVTSAFTVNDAGSASGQAVVKAETPIKAETA